MFGISVMKCVLPMSQSSSALLSEHVLASPTASTQIDGFQRRERATLAQLGTFFQRSECA